MNTLRSRFFVFALAVFFFFPYGCSTFYTPSGPSKKVSVSKKKSKKTGVKKKKRRRKKALLPWPVNGVVTSGFGKRKGRQHEGIDIAAPLGTKIRAVARGEVIFSGWGPTGYGKMVIIKHSAK
ncbi:MAG: murein hydrolase activator EnvC family protein, partial [Nitrospinota bacterium]